MPDRSFYSNKTDENALPASKPQSPDTIVIDGKEIASYPPLEAATGKARTWISANVASTVDLFNEYKAKTAAEVAKVEANYHKIIVDPLLPQSLYVITAFLTGSILARRRSPAAKFFYPTVFGVASFAVFMPKSFSNCTHAISQWEATQFPEVKKTQDEFNAQVGKGISAVTNSTKTAETALAGQISKAREALDQWLKKD